MACAVHPAVDESYACTSCAARWCSECVTRVGLTHRRSCPTCGYEATTAVPERAGGEIADITRRVVSLEGLTTAAAFAVPFALSNWFQVLAGFYLSALVGYYFTIIHHVGASREGLPGPSDATEDWVEICGFALRGIACVAVGFAPLIAWFAVTRDAPTSELTLGLVFAGQIYMPAVVLAVALTNTAVAVIWPVAWVRVIARAPAKYARFVGIWIVSIAVGFAIYMTTALAFAPYGALGLFGAAIAWNVFWFAQAALVGHFLRANAAAFGWD